MPIALVFKGYRLFSFGCHVTPAKSEQIKIRVQNVKMAGSEPLLMSSTSALGIVIHGVLSYLT